MPDGRLSGMTSAADYAWTGTGLAQCFCFTLVRGIGAAELLDRLAATGRGGPVSLDELRSSAYDVDITSRLALSGAKDLDGWTAWVEPSGFAATQSEPLSAAGGRVVVIENNPKGGGDFRWFEDGELKLRFEPAFAGERDGSDPDALYDEMERLGFEVEEDADDDYEIGPVSEATYALMEHLTGIRLTPQLLADGYLTGLVELPG